MSNELKVGKLDEYSVRRNQLDMSTIVYASVTFDKSLTRNVLYPAVAKVISQNINLAINIFNAETKKPVRRPVSKVDLDEVVQFHPEWDIESFIDETFENVSANHRYDTDKPLWKLYILNKEQNLAVFGFDHSVLDGTSGSIFVKQLAAALNSSTNDDLPSLDSSIVPTPTIKQTPGIEEFGQTKPPFFFAMKFLAKLLKNAVFGGAKKFTGPPGCSPINQKTIVRIIDTEQTAKILKAAKARGITVHALLSTALLQTVVTNYLDDDYLKGGTVSISSPINARRYLPASVENAMGNYVYNHSEHFKDDFASFKKSFDGSLNDKWAKQYNASLKKALKERKEIAYLIGMLGYVDLKKYLEDEVKHKRRHDSIEVSNLGVSEFVDGEFKVTHTSLGQPVTGIGAPFIVSVATVKNGPMSVVVSAAADDEAKSRCHTVWNGVKQILDSL